MVTGWVSRSRSDRGLDPGHDKVKVNDKIDEAFKERNDQYNNLSFKCGHVLGLLRGTAKFNFITTRHSIPRDVSQGMDSSPSTPIIGSNESPDQSREYHSGDKRSRYSGEEEVSSPVKHPQRPMGNKAAKKASRGKAKVGGASHMSIDEGLTVEDRKWMLQEELSLKRQSHVDRMKLLQEVSDNQAIATQSQALVAQNNARRLDMEQQKIQLRIQHLEEDKEIRSRQLEQDRDMKIMDKDLNSIACDEQREKWRRMQQKIWDKWNL